MQSGFTCSLRAGRRQLTRKQCLAIRVLRFTMTSSREAVASPLPDAHLQLPVTTASGHLSPSSLVRCHPARGAASPLLHVHFQLPMTTASDHTSPSDVV